MAIRTKLVAPIAGALAIVALAQGAPAAEKINFILNWVPGADHAPYFYADAKGWYKEAGLEVEIPSTTSIRCATPSRSAMPPPRWPYMPTACTSSK